MIKLILLLFGLFGVVNSSCGPTCSCPPLQSLNDQRDESEPLPPANCNPTKTCNIYALVLFYWPDTEIPTPSDAVLEEYVISEIGNEMIDLVNTFGIYCENGSWYATKYPGGVKYLDNQGSISRMVVPEHPDGGNYKSKLTIFVCE